MIAGMAPRLDPADYAFVAAPLPEPVRSQAIGWFREDEGESFIVPATLAPREARFRRITLQVHSALDGIGLTAAVATALAEAGIACNMVAALRHDHVFVPADQAEAALSVLRRLQMSVHSAPTNSVRR